MIDDRDLSHALHDLAEHDDVGAPPVHDLLERGRRARTGRITVGAAATVTAGALVATAVWAAPRGGQQAAAGGPVPLATAAQATERTTFRFAMNASWLPPGIKEASTGAYDPTRQRGYLTYGAVEARRVGPECFSANTAAPHVSASDSPSPGAPPPGTWQRAWTCGQFESTRPFIDGFPDPVTLADRIAAGSVSYAGRTGAGSRAVDTYRYHYDETIKVPPNFPDPRITEHLTGIVEINVATRRITRITADMTSTASPSPQTKVDTPRRYQIELTLSDFGTRVDVAAPGNPLPPDPTASPASR